MGIFKKKKKLETNSMEQGVRLITVSAPSSVNTEQFNTIRTNIEFSNADEQIKSLVMTSATASEGKSTVAANLAVAFARQGKRVLLVDTDLRRPTINATFSISNPIGLTNFLTEHSVSVNDIFYKTSVDNLYVLPSGPTPPNPSELIGSKRMSNLITALQDAFDLVIYDAPPVLSVTDAQILSTKVDGTIVVVRENRAEKEAVRQAVKLIKHVDGKIIGSILNDADGDSVGYYGYYGYYGK
ncbi:CpsD/CapB family tyrosine-protein kinase [Ligilactobacillus apodemi]|uniref:Tyrosine-protein kinase CpsD n=1 Tax=Ligilactobacillus apodemi DSM 16634 = JCM 16172 TaxID=1423724 RepID=A0A0R1U433_9LACO|nr:CpsD/CapB family tyrosine-protein kinase [Ligilactobacillus apodemi]KRL87444.1 non-specific protein-tyrosine kinase [Ligilactobacillus apodemi DSM 16634 = JCM 16172]MCR1901919.1 CpsD/CapB family tyrosine-protein kinase [Ligilactobacillus apodemi]